MKFRFRPKCASGSGEGFTPSRLLPLLKVILLALFYVLLQVGEREVDEREVGLTYIATQIVCLPPMCIKLRLL